MDTIIFPKNPRLLILPILYIHVDFLRLRISAMKERILMTPRFFRRIVAITLACSAMTTTTALAEAGPALAVNVSADRHPISPDIYGMAYPDPAMAREIHLPLLRWGGDSTTRYNWQVDASNSGDDWYFVCGKRQRSLPSSEPDSMVNAARSWGGRAMLTVPLIDYINKSPFWDCSYPVSIFGRQQKVNPYLHPTVNGVHTDAGNGKTPDGKPIVMTEEQILRTNRKNTPEFEQGWIKHLVEKFGTTANGGVGIYELDNEPGGWNNTHRDVHPDQTGHDELVSRSIKYGEAIKAIDPSAIVLGPGDFVMHYQSDGTATDGKKQHNGLGQGDYYLQKMREYEQQHGHRLLDYFDEHYYPLDQEGENDDIRLEATRSLWDPSYKEKNWVGKWRGAVDLIPTFHKWVDQEYPGTKVSISEYGWGDPKKFIMALCEIDVLGIFGRERLDMACLFGPPKVAEPGANAFRLYRDYDGKGGQFGDVAVQSQSDDQGKLSVYAAERTSDHALTIIVVNKSHADLSSKLTLGGFTPAGSGTVYRYSEENLRSLVHLEDQPIATDGFTATYPTRSATLFVVPVKN
jgi:hypothetical protein